MAIHEAHSEDLFAEAAALTRRIELHVPGQAAPVVAGCRTNGAWSIYFGPDPCFHFDSQGLLRRAFVDDRLYRTQGRTLAGLSRRRHEGTVELLRSDLNAAECRDFLERLRVRLESLRHSLVQGSAVRLRAHLDDGELEADLSAALQRIIEAGPALAPPFPTRKD